MASLLRFRRALQGGQVQSWAQDDRAFTAAPGAHDGVELAWVTAGTARYRIGRRDFDVEVGQAIVVPAGVEHRTTIGAGLRAGSAWLDRPVLDEIADAMNMRVPTEADLLGSPARLVALGDLLRSELETSQRGSEIAAQGLLEAVAVELLRGRTSAPVAAESAIEPRARSARHPCLRRALRFIEAHFAEPLTIERIAKEAGMSRFHLSRLFRDELGIAPYQYLLQVRIERAAELLRGGAAVTETALCVGVSDPSRFAAAFRRRFGVSPKELVRRARMRKTHARFRHDSRVEEHDSHGVKNTG